MNLEISDIQLSSKCTQSDHQKMVETSSTDNNSKISVCSSSAYNRRSIKSSNRNVQKKINQIELSQKQLEQKFKKVIDNLLKEITQKQQLNTHLQEQVDQLKINIEESRNDIKVISNYMRKKQEKNLRNSNKNNKIITSNTIENSRSLKNIETENGNRSGRDQKKSKSPRTILLKRNIFH